MDRGYRAVLGWFAGAVLGLGIVVGESHAQPPTTGPTPWVQAPPAASVPPGAAPMPSASPSPSGTPAVTVSPTKPTPGPKAKPAAPGPGTHPAAPNFGGTVEDTKAKMERERKRELAQGHEEQAPGEQRTFEQNLQLWDRMTRDERQAIRAEVGGRIRVEMDEAYKRSGLNLDDDQREMFDLRYRQERRRVEREVQEIARRERERRLPAVDEQMRKEFGKASAANTAKATAIPAATAAATPTPTPKPMPTATAGLTPAPKPTPTATAGLSASPVKE